MILLGEESSLSQFTSQDVIPQTYNYWGQFFSMLLTLGFILCLIFVSVYFLKRVMRSRMHQLNKSTGIKILERRALSSKSSLYLVDILGKGVVISESASGINVITEFPVNMNVEDMLEKLQQDEAPSFKDSLIKKIRKLSSRHA